MGISISAYTTENIDLLRLISAVGHALDPTPAPETGTAYPVEMPGFHDFITKLDIDDARTSSSADIPDSIEEDFDVTCLSITDIRIPREPLGDASIYTRDTENGKLGPFTIRTDIELLTAYSRVRFGGNGAYDSARKFAQMAGPGRVIIVNEQTGDSFTGNEFMSFTELNLF